MSPKGDVPSEKYPKNPTLNAQNDPRTQFSCCKMKFFIPRWLWLVRTGTLPMRRQWRLGGRRTPSSSIRLTRSDLKRRKCVLKRGRRARIGFSKDFCPGNHMGGPLNPCGGGELLVIFLQLLNIISIKVKCFQLLGLFLRLLNFQSRSMTSWGEQLPVLL